MAHIDPDADLIPGLRAGQSHALEAMMDRHMSKIHALAFYMLGDNMLAEDVTQDSFIKLWQAAPKWQEGQAKILTWLRRVTTNRCLDHLRRRAPIYTDKLPDTEDDTRRADEALIEDDQAKSVQNAMQNLPEKQRAAIALSYYQNVSQKEGAKILNVSQKAYESLLSRARRNLKNDLLAEKERGMLL